MTKAFKIVVLAKQVPDTRNVGKNAMKEDGTVNRAALPAIFNPEDMNALEQALRIKDKYPESKVLLLTMGPGRAADIIREGLFRGADGGILLTDRKFAGADTLATSYAISMALKKMKPDLIFAGRQAIDGDTAQVGPQVAQKLDLPQVTYAEEVVDIINDKIKIKRRLERGVETVESSLPVVVTVHATAPDCRPRNAKFLMKYKHARTTSEEHDNEHNSYLPLYTMDYLRIEEWGVNEIGGDEKNYGLSGSPTKVKKIENIVFQAKEAKMLTSSVQDMDLLMKELIASHTIG
ncbi:MAG: electron transfer flavoprotein subunit beta/FixA family protein [Bacteroidales bacterium]|jgi:electron transfer flavoprotein beta subunit|nr:electron transfer flavoprotein subunit beta/FixA family protein [Bacteroidales bacterium]